MSLNAHGPRSPVHPLRLELELYNFGQWDDTTKKHRTFVITKGILKDVSSYVELRSISFKLSSISLKRTNNKCFDYMTSMLSMIVCLKHVYVGECGDEVDAH